MSRSNRNDLVIESGGDIERILSDDSTKDYSPRSEGSAPDDATLGRKVRKSPADLLLSRSKSSEKIGKKKSSEYLTRSNLERHGSLQSINSDDSNNNSPDVNSRFERRRMNTKKSRERIQQSDSLLSMVSDDGHRKGTDRSLSRSKSQGSIRSEEDLSDLDDDDMEDNAETVDWLAEEDEEEELPTVDVTKPNKPQVTDPFLLANLDTYLALCDMEDLNFEQLEYSKQVDLIGTLTIEYYSPGDEIFHEDDPEYQPLYIVVASDRTYKVAEVEMIRKSEDKLTKIVTRIRRGQYFGQKYFLHKQAQARDFTIRIPADLSCSTVAVARLNEEHFDKWHNLRNALLVRAVPLMQLLKHQDRQEIIAQMVLRTYEKDDFIIRQGDQGDEFFIIIEGCCDIREDRLAADGRMVSVKLVTLREGHFFGEMSLVFDEPRVASVIAMGHVVCLALAKKVFQSALSADIFSQVLNEVLEKRKKMREQRQSVGAKASVVAEAPSAAAPTTDKVDQASTEVRVTSSVSLKKLGTGEKVVNKYRLIKELGAGSYAEVHLCRDETTGLLYAMKVMARPTKKIESDEIEEIAIMKKLKHENIVGLHEVIDDATKSRKIYIIQEYVAGGALMPDTDVCEPFPVDLARKYFRDVVKGIRYLHSKGIVHRDIKPQNLLISSEGIVKLADFGASVLSNNGDEKRNEGGNGTPAFMAPELFQVAGTNQEKIDLHATDIWSLGVTLYFMVMGRTPWGSFSNEIDLAHTVQSMEITFPDEKIDPHLKHLLREMLDKDYHTRIKLDRIIQDDWVTQEGSDPLFSEEDIIEEQRHQYVGHVLVIDNTIEGRHMISRKLDQANCSYILAADADEGINLVKQNMANGTTAFACVIVDFNMPTKVGLAAVAEIRGIGYCGKIIGTCSFDAQTIGLIRERYSGQSSGGSTSPIVGKALKSTLQGLSLYTRPAPTSPTALPTEIRQCEYFKAMKSAFISCGADDFWDKPVHSIEIVQLLQEPKLSEKESPGKESTSISVGDLSHAIEKIALSDESSEVRQDSSPSLSSIPSTEQVFGDVAEENSSPLRALKYRSASSFKKSPMEASFMINNMDFHLGNSYLPRVNSLEPYRLRRYNTGSSTNSFGDSSVHSGIGERTLSRTRDFLLVPSDIILVPSNNGKTFEKSIAYRGEETVKSSFYQTDRKTRRERALQKSKQRHGSRMSMSSDATTGSDNWSSMDPVRVCSEISLISSENSDDDDDDYAASTLRTFTSPGGVGIAESPGKKFRGASIKTLDSTEYSPLNSPVNRVVDLKFEEDEFLMDSEDDEVFGSHGDDDDDFADADEVQLLDANEFDLMMDEIGAKKKNDNDVLWNVIRNEALPSLVAPDVNVNHDMKLSFAKYDSIGLRPYMEDRIFFTPDLIATCASPDDDPSLALLGGLHMAFMGVYDGHSGYYVAEYLQKNLHKVYYEILMASQSGLTDETGAENNHSGTDWMLQCFEEACTSIDRAIIEIDWSRQKACLQSGTLSSEVFGGSVAAMVAFVQLPSHPKELFALVAHVGDCRAVISDAGIAVQVTDDHKPSVSAEKERIEASGGWVHKNRVNGLLAVSRSFGDINFKAVEDFMNDYSTYLGDTDMRPNRVSRVVSKLKECEAGNKHIAAAAEIFTWCEIQQVTSLPSTKQVAIKPTYEFMIIASDGLWDVFTCQEAVNFTRWVLKESNFNLEVAAQRLIEEAEARDTQDNVSCIVCAFN